MALAEGACSLSTSSWRCEEAGATAEAASAAQPARPQTWKQRWRERRAQRLQEARGGLNHLRRMFKRAEQTQARAAEGVLQQPSPVWHRPTLQPRRQRTKSASC